MAIVETIERKLMGERKANLVQSLAELLAEPFGICDRETMQRVSLITHYFDTFTHLLDDATDEKGSNFAYLSHAAISDLFLGVGKIFETSQHPERVFEKVFNYWKVASEGERYLLRHHGKLIPYDENDFVMLGKRGSMAKVPIALYSDVSQTQRPVMHLENGIECAGTVVQLFDDVFDWREDLSKGIYTHPIVLTHQKTKCLDMNTIERGLFYDGVFNKVLDICSPYLKEAGQLFKRAGANKMSDLLSAFELNIYNLRGYTQDLINRKSFSEGVTEEIKRITHPLLTAH